MYEPHLIDSQKGRPLLCFRGYVYQHHDFNKDRTKIYWRCSERKICNASATTNSDLDNIRVQRDGTNKHLHAPDHAGIEVKRIVNRVKTRARVEPNATPAAVLIATVGNPGEEVSQRMPERRSLKRLVNRVQVRNRPPNPRTLHELLILAPYDRTIRDQQFLMFDSGQENDNRILIFASDDAFRVLAQCDMIFTDGTFKVTPQSFAQLFSVHGRYLGFVFPLVFCLTTRLTEDTYFTVYEQILMRCAHLGVEIRPEGHTVMMDFEIAKLQAAGRAFAGAQIKRCLFHYCQMIWRHVINLGLRGAYEKVDGNIR